MVSHATLEAEARESQIPGHAGLYSKALSQNKEVKSRVMAT
jgi:hypothetical protein